MATPFCTQPIDKTEQKNLRNYIDNIYDKLDYAKWKQDLVLNYNYMPLKNIKDKIQSQRQNYIKKMKEEERRLIGQIDNQQMNVQLQHFRDFKVKLQQKMKEIQNQIDSQEMKIKILKAQVIDKKNRLKDVMKGNMNLTKTIFEQNGIKTKNDILKLTRSHSTKKRLFPLQSRKNSLVSAQKYQSQRTTATMFDKTLFKECLQSMVSSLKSMKSSEDVQAGIYLDIMNKKQHLKSGKYSAKSLICNTLMDRYGSLRSDKKKTQNQDFQMSWQTFQNLNWKQIMGIVLVKDRKCQKLSKLLELKE